jgi:hypothetical protein
MTTARHRIDSFSTHHAIDCLEAGTLKPVKVAVTFKRHDSAPCHGTLTATFSVPEIQTWPGGPDLDDVAGLAQSVSEAIPDVVAARLGLTRPAAPKAQEAPAPAPEAPAPPALVALPFPLLGGVDAGCAFLHGAYGSNPWSPSSKQVAGAREVAQAQRAVDLEQVRALLDACQALTDAVVDNPFTAPGIVSKAEALRAEMHRAQLGLPARKAAP